MKHKWKIIICILFLLLMSLIMNDKMNNEMIWKDKASHYIESTYNGQFKLLHTQKKDNEYIFSFGTKDNNHISFTVTGWIGGCSTPCGTLEFIPQRYFIDNFPEQLTKKIVDDTMVYDMTDSTIEDISKNIKALSDEVQDLYDFYKLSWKVPNIRMKKKHNGKIANINYTNQHDSILHDMLIRKFY